MPMEGIVKLLGMLWSPGNSRHFPDAMSADPTFRCCGLHYSNARLAIEHPPRPTIRLLRTFGEC